MATGERNHKFRWTRYANFGREDHQEPLKKAVGLPVGSVGKKRWKKFNKPLEFFAHPLKALVSRWNLPVQRKTVVVRFRVRGHNYVKPTKSSQGQSNDKRVAKKRLRESGSQTEEDIIPKVTLH